MKKIKVLLFSIIICFCTSCIQDYTRTISSSINWTALQLNDTIIMFMPKSDTNKPFVINLNYCKNNEIENNEIENNEFITPEINQEDHEGMVE